MNMKLMLKFDDRLSTVLNEEFAANYDAAVGVVQCGDRWLLGLSKSKDDRANRWCFPGGGIKNREAAKKAAERETWEESGIKCKAAGEPFALPGKKKVAFVYCKAKPGQDVDFNNEFAAMGFFTVEEMKSLKLYGNVLKLIDRARRK